jgi:hypothetical protein
MTALAELQVKTAGAGVSLATVRIFRDEAVKADFKR